MDGYVSDRRVERGRNGRRHRGGKRGQVDTHSAIISGGIQESLKVTSPHTTPSRNGDLNTSTLSEIMSREVIILRCATLRLMH